MKDEGRRMNKAETGKQKAGKRINGLPISAFCFPPAFLLSQCLSDVLADGGGLVG